VQKRTTRAATLAAALAAFAPAAHAQGGSIDPRCSGAGVLIVAQDACQKAIDVFSLVAPQLGTAAAGGNAVLGGTGTLGGLPHFSVGLRVNALRGKIPQPQSVQLNLTGARASELGSEDQWVGLPAAEAAVGLFKGIPVGLTNVGGVDALVSAFYVPSASTDDFSLDGGSLKFGFGGRLGVIQETALLPGVSISYLRRDLPTVNAAARVGVNDSVRVRDLEVQTSAWRAVIGKRFLFIGLAAGAGQDTYESSARLGAYVAPRNGVGFDGPIGAVEQKVTRTNYFVDLSFNLPFLRIAGEIGRAQGGELPATYNSFGGARPDDAYTYGSVGLRVAF
jgi:hypothetical protein